MSNIMNFAERHSIRAQELDPLDHRIIRAHANLSVAGVQPNWAMVAKNLGITWDEARQRTNRLAGLGHIIYADPAAVEAANEAAAREALNPEELDDGDRAIMAYKRGAEAEGRSSNWQMISDALNMPIPEVRRHTEKLIALGHIALADPDGHAKMLAEYDAKQMREILALSAPPRPRDPEREAYYLARANEGISA